MKKLLTIIFLILLPSNSFALSEEYITDLTDLINTEMKQWSHKDVVVTAVEAQNEKHADISLTDMKILDNKWRGEKRKNKRPLTKKVLSSELSDYLRKIQSEGQGLYTEIIVIDKKGINVGQSILSTNYWQGQQAKFKKTLGSKSYATYMSDLSFDDNTELFQVEVSFMIIANEEPIGLLYAGIDVEQLEDWKKRREEQ